MLLQQYTVFYGLLHWRTVSNDTGASMCFSSLMVPVTVSLNCQMPVLPQTYVPRNVHKSAETLFCQRFQQIFAKCRASWPWNSRAKLNLMMICRHFLSFHSVWCCKTLPEAQRTQKLTPWLGLNLSTTLVFVKKSVLFFQKKVKWRHLVAKFAINASGATWWPNFELGGQICN